MKKDHDSVLEKLVLFWHDHFATQYANCDPIPALLMLNQNQLFRSNFAGSFKKLLEEISIDGAMLRYLNGNENDAEAPNENYARELLELFSLGVGNYTEQDIREAAKILTGWKVNIFSNETETPFKPYLSEKAFDKNTKIFMGESFTVNYTINTQNVYENSVKKLISVVLNKKGSEASKFLMTKIYEYYVYANEAKTDKNIIDQMAKQFVDSGFTLKPVLKTLFSSEHFFDPNIIGSQIKSPIETVIGVVRHFKYSDIYARNVMMELGQEPFNPPNVAGWKAYRTWINTVTLPKTIFFLKEIINNNSSEELGAWAKKVLKHEELDSFVKTVAELFLAKPTESSKIKKYKEVLLSSAPENEWQEIVKNQTVLGQRLRNLLFEIIKAPDFYLY
jgi:uncharacterized protein (DUF1800 family)